MWPSGNFQDTPTWDPFLRPQDRWGCNHGDDLRVSIRRDLPSAQEVSQYKGTICSTSCWSQGPQGAGDIGALDKGLLLPFI